MSAMFESLGDQLKLPLPETAGMVASVADYQCALQACAPVPADETLRVEHAETYKSDGLLLWWQERFRRHADERSSFNLARLFNVVRRVVLIQPSSAAAERGFSHLVKDGSPHELSDSRVAKVMCRFNVPRDGLVAGSLPFDATVL